MNDEFSSIVDTETRGYSIPVIGEDYLWNTLLN